jgi:L-alanine-DL-glutamate epimerase-like enolase superfamily enzyme
MQIKSIEVKEVLLEREEEFVIATGTSESALNFVARIETEDFCGFGSCCPNSVTGETPESIREDLKSLSGKLVGEDPTNIQALNEKMASSHPESYCARACLDIALWDVVGKASERPLYDVLGGSRDRMMTDMSMGIMDFDKTVETAKRIASRGFKAIKMKIGLDIDTDIAKLQAVKEEVPDDIALSVDANQGYSYEKAVEFVKRTKDMGLAYLEQPVSQNDFTSLRKLDELSLVPIMADESFQTSQEAAALLAGRTVRLLNIKLLKCGGITESLVIESICAALNGGTQVGCYSESALSIAAGLHFALAGSTIEFLDLDSHFNFPDDFAKNALGSESGLLVVSGRHGLGVEVDFDSLG